VKSLETPLKSLIQGNWFKLICGASFQDLPAIRSLAIAYSLAGADCIDVAMDPAVINATKEGLKVAKNLIIEGKKKGFNYYNSPWLMVSINDGEDPHFRKAEFNPLLCPVDCPRPCENICPANAIQFNNNINGDQQKGVIDQKCYGCGRCIPICPLGLIVTRSYVSNANGIIPLIKNLEIDAIEIHTQVGNKEDFKRLWHNLAPIIPSLKLLAISCQDHQNIIPYLKELYGIISPLSCALIWQTDGRPMSGDIGIGTTHPAVKMAQKVIKANLPGFIQLAGGTNHHTVKKLQEKQLMKRDFSTLNMDLSLISKTVFPYVAGVAYGSYGRKLLTPLLGQLETSTKSIYLEKNPELLWQTIAKADQLVSQIKLRTKTEN
jgi:Fe-S-cluster-containing hydrogenase component 2